MQPYFNLFVKFSDRKEYTDVCRTLCCKDVLCYSAQQRISAKVTCIHFRPNSRLQSKPDKFSINRLCDIIQQDLVRKAEII